ncbi:hypothetical protein [Rubellimicrobium roseum]|uniref:Uncharacterized protein n=1 Tax=Rubellimicrobium roseum TaxID=687525 RepID=A0A5C4N8X5_9RHOB|nr:hypothetical protein [Rubellimicrobium roseum]TNC62077.1 hypothetical protein FHG71_20580 [Rubellimicrobium roseum]
MDDCKLCILERRLETLDAEVDALRLLVLTLIGRMAIDDPHQIQAVARMVEAAGDAMRSAEEATERHRSIAREIENVSGLVRHVTRSSQH